MPWPPRASSAAIVAERDGSWHSPVPVDPEDVGRRDRVEVELVGPDLEVGRGREPVEVEREVVGREDLAERHRRAAGPGTADDEPVVDAEAAQGLVDVAAERVRRRCG